LRIAGAVVGGFGLGMGAQIFILPYLDSIAGFTVLFVPVAAISAWIATSSSRISYFGFQIAVAFFLINLSEFQIQTSLAVARDRVVGILLGLSMMWLAFDQLWRAPAGVQMKRIFVANLRLLAQLTREPVSENLDAAMARGISLRETIQKQFDKVRSLADGVLFEFGPTRGPDLALRDRIRRWQPKLRTFFVLRNTLIKYRLQLRGFELPENVRQAQQQFDEHLARRLDDMANRLERGASHAEGQPEAWFEPLAETVRTSNLAAQLGAFLQMSQTTENLIVFLDANA
jgi:multidrug resistance protein MdtO